MPNCRWGVGGGWEVGQLFGTSRSTRQDQKVRAAAVTVIRMYQGSSIRLGPSAKARQMCTHTSKANSVPVVMTYALMISPPEVKQRPYGNAVISKTKLSRPVASKREPARTPPSFWMAFCERMFFGPMRKTTRFTNLKAWRSMSRFISPL